MTKFEQFKDELESLDFSDQLAIYNEYEIEANADREWYNMEDFDELNAGAKPLDLAMRIHFGEFNPNHDYWRYDGYGNFKSGYESDVWEDIEMELDEIFAHPAESRWMEYIDLDEEEEDD